jgi:microcystin-dependent protein
MEEYLGVIKLFAGTYCPENYMYCDGQTLQISQYNALYAILGTQYGGDGRVTFNLPTLNKVPFYQGTYLKYMICTQGIFPSRQ